MNTKQIKALADAHAAAAGTGLEKSTGGWRAAAEHSETHAHQTIKALVDRGCIELYASGTVAHITDLGARSLEIELEAQRS